MEITRDMIQEMANGTKPIIKRAYGVWQGVVQKDGGGNLDGPIFSTKKEALKYFNDIKNDVKGWTSHGILTTQIQQMEWNCDDNSYFNEIPNFIKWYEREV